MFKKETVKDQMERDINTGLGGECNEIVEIKDDYK